MNIRAGWMALSVFAAGVAFTAIIGTPGCGKGVPRDTTAMPSPPKVLTVLTPHNERIRDAFAAGFWDWYLKQKKTPVRIEWIYRGTPQCVEYIQQVPRMRAEGAPVQAPDVMFGGGIPDHSALAELGLCRTIDPGPAARDFPAQVNGLPTRDEQGRWFATAASSFGILYNDAACRERGIAPPTTWADLADPRFYGWVAMADPRHSGSNRECLLLMLQQGGWDVGWGSVLRVLANARALSDRSSDALRQVQTGSALATFAVNYDGMSLAAESGGALQYIDPPNATAVTPDIVSVLATSDDPELATDFVRYLLSDAGQALWGVAGEYRTPPGDTLYHYPLAPALYADMSKLGVRANPLQTDFGLRLDGPDVTWERELLPQLVRAACGGGRHIQLQLAWRAAIDAGLPEAAVAALTAPPLPESQASAAASAATQPSDTDAKVAEWADAISGRYAKVRDLLKQ